MNNADRARMSDADRAGEERAGDKAGFFDAQYGAMAGDETQALDHPLYRYLLPYAKTRVDVAAGMLSGRSYEHVVELGVGDGGLLARMAPSFRAYDGFDISEFQLGLIPRELRERAHVRFHRADLEAPVPLPDGRADLVVSLSTIEYLRAPEPFVREAFRLLAPGGLLLLHTMNIAFLPRRLQLLFGELPTFNAAAGWQGGVLHNFTFPRLRALLQGENFAVEAERCAGLLPPLRLWWKNALASDMLFLARKRG
jgi:SAM-dependent methyltransferase